MSKLLIFDIWGDYAHFRKPYTTTSPLTYSIPSRTSLTGIIGAIIGLEKEKNNCELNYEKCNLSLRLINPVKKVLLNQNLINTKIAVMMSRIKPKGGRTQIRFETLKDIKYRVYVEIFDPANHEKLKNKLKKHNPYFNVCFGISEHIANFNYIGEFNYTEKKGNIDIFSVINLEKIDKEALIFENGKEYFTDTYSLEMKEDREVCKYGEVLIERTGKNISVKNLNYIKINNGENIIWL